MDPGCIQDQIPFFGPKGYGIEGLGGKEYLRKIQATPMGKKLHGGHIQEYPEVYFPLLHIQWCLVRPIKEFG